jgi:hypothetical protein
MKTARHTSIALHDVELCWSDPEEPCLLDESLCRLPAQWWAALNVSRHYKTSVRMTATDGIRFRKLIVIPDAPVERTRDVRWGGV